MDLREIARKYALKNAYEYGKAQTGNIIGKVIADAPEAKKDVKAAMQIVSEVVAEVNALPRGRIEAELSKYEFTKKEEAPKRWELPGAVEGKVVTRFLPEPNGHMHIGHAKSAWLSAEFARQWKGKIILRFDDTNPEKEKAEYVNAIREAAKWLGLEFARESFTSDMMPQFYHYAKKMIENGDAYVCTCPREEIAKKRAAGEECTCRSNSPKRNLEMWGEMISGKLEEGQAILRLKGDMKALNTVMRDPTLFRIVKTPHYRKGTQYCVWPTYDFEVSIADSLDGVTHALRSKEYELRDELYYEIVGRLGLRKPYIYDFSRLQLKGTMLSKRFLAPLIEQGKVFGWDDPRLPTILGLKRRGILPEAIKDFVLSFGLSKVESEPNWDALLSENRRLLDPIAEHYFFVPQPVRVGVKNATNEIVKLKKLHTPNSPVREIKTTSVFYIPKSDADALAIGETVRLKDLYNIRITGRATDGSLSAEYVGNESIEAKKIQWVGEPYVEISVAVLGDLFRDGEFNPDSLRWDVGFAEPAVGKLAEGSIVQFERYGFCRLDNKKEMKFILSCK